MRKFLVSEFAQLNYTLEVDEFTATTPLGPRKMANILAKSPNETPANVETADLPRQRSIIAAHYDSKLEPQGMVGAIDSSVPCAVLLFAAKTLAKSQLPAPPLDFVFFDGEEALVEWSETDSLYGARRFVETRPLPPGMILLDLLGAPDTALIPSWFQNTYNWHLNMFKLNQRLVDLKLMSRLLLDDGERYHQYAGYMLDDHTPFWKRGVPCLHLIPPSFPKQWHTLEDNASNLDPQAVRDWAVLVTLWLAQYEAGNEAGQEIHVDL